MKIGLYPKLAFDGIRKNKRMYLPYIMTCIGMVTMYYIISFLSNSELIGSMSGGETVRSVLSFGKFVIAAFALIFLFYTNSFLIRRRNKEFGLYNILGMGKKNIARILVWESLIVTVIALLFGLGIGIAMSKMAELALIDILGGSVDFSFYVSPVSCVEALVIFAVIFSLILANNIRRIKFSSPTELLKSDTVGEKPPRANFVLGILGVLLLGAAYFMAVTIKDPHSAIAMFFVAVLMVIAATYLLFISGSVMFCRILQKNKKYYYKPNHFVSVSQMAYRMKRNGAGLAGICILATMVLVMLSSTACLFFGIEDSLKSRYPKDIDISVYTYDTAGLSDESASEFREKIDKVVSDDGSSRTSTLFYRYAKAICKIDNGTLARHDEESDTSKDKKFDRWDVFFVPLSDYNSVTGKNETLAENEILVCSVKADYAENTLSLYGKNTLNVKKHVDVFIDADSSATNSIPSLYVVVPDIESASEDGEARFGKIFYAFDTDSDPDTQIALKHKLNALLENLSEDKDSIFGSYLCESRAENRNDFYASNGSLFFLGILLSIVFVFSAVLIIYYKQITEGYEDRAGFEIMQKVGMTKKEIRKSINSQLLTVFLMPLAGAGMHLAFAFPMIRKALLLFNLNNAKLFAVTSILSFAAFSILYASIYKITSGAYCKIVSDASSDRGIT